MKKGNFDFSTANNGFHNLDFRFFISDFGFRISDFGFRISNFGFQTPNSVFISNFTFWILYFEVCISERSGSAFSMTGEAMRKKY